MQIVDLSHHYSNDMPIYPGIPRPLFTDIARVEVDGYAMSEYRLINHTGTHIDAPSHQVLGATMDDIPLDRLVTDGCVLDFTQHPRGPISAETITPHLEKVRAGDMVIINSGGWRLWGSDAYWTGWCYPDKEATQLLIERDISGVGFDGPSADPVDTPDFGIHKVWLSAGRLILENLTNLDQLPERTLLVVAPMKVRGANGGPSRVFALIF